MILSSFLFKKLLSEDERGKQLFEDEISEIPKAVLGYEINGSLFFGASQKFQDVVSGLNFKPEIQI